MEPTHQRAEYNCLKLSHENKTRIVISFASRRGRRKKKHWRQRRKNCANNSLVYVQYPREATVLCGTIFCCRPTLHSLSFLLLQCSLLGAGNVCGGRAQRVAFLFVIILNKAPGEENCLTIIILRFEFAFIYFRHWCFFCAKLRLPQGLEWTVNHLLLLCLLSRRLSSDKIKIMKKKSVDDGNKRIYGDWCAHKTRNKLVRVCFLTCQISVVIREFISGCILSLVFWLVKVHSLC